MMILPPRVSGGRQRLPAAARASRPYHVGRARAKDQLRQALASTDDSSKARRIQQVIDTNRVDRADSESKQLLTQAARVLRQLSVIHQKAAAKHQGDEARLAKHELPQQALLKLSSESRGRAPLQCSESDYSWIRRANDSADREARREISALTRQATDAGGYQLGEAKVYLRNVKSMLSGTRLVSPSLSAAAFWPSAQDLADAKWSCKTRMSVRRGTVLEVAVAYALEGKLVSAVNAASGYHAGGGFLTGGRHALEEAMCVQSTLFSSLERGVDLAESAGVSATSWARPARHPRDGTEWLAHLPDDGVLLSPHVEVFRSGTNAGYAFDDAATRLEAVVSVAMPNCNDRMSDSPVDAHPDAEAYEAQLVKKWRAVLTAAAFLSSSNCLIIPDAGCGVFRNPPEKVGEALGRVLREEFQGRFEEVVIAFPGGKAGEEFAAAATTAFQELDASAGQPKRGGFRWEFTVKDGFAPFDEDCQSSLEAQYARFLEGPDRSPDAKVISNGHTIVVNFAKMKQHIEDSDRYRDVRRIRCD